LLYLIAKHQQTELEQKSLASLVELVDESFRKQHIPSVFFSEEDRLARLYLAEDHLLEAEKLVQNSKSNPLWLPLHAVLAEKKNDLHRSASLWQQVEKQSLAGNEIWLDVRLKRLSVLHQFDKPNAVELLHRTIALNPNMPPTYAT